MSHSLLKLGALTAAIVLATVPAVLAAPHADIAYNTPIKAQPKPMATNIGWAVAGDTVLVLSCVPNYGGWCKIKMGGPAGWVKKAALDFYGYGPGPMPGPYPYPAPAPYPYPSGPSACFSGPLGYFCVNP
jgi:uncharacterized protein YraI